MILLILNCGGISIVARVYISPCSLWFAKQTHCESVREFSCLAETEKTSVNDNFFTLRIDKGLCTFLSCTLLGFWGYEGILGTAMILNCVEMSRSHLNYSR
jgi:hypothetical protein